MGCGIEPSEPDARLAAAELLSVSRRTIYNRIREGKLLTIRTIGGSQRVLLSSLADDRRPMWASIKTEAVRAPDRLEPPEAFATRRRNNAES